MTIDRRSFIKTLGAATGAIAMGSPLSSAAAEDHSKKLERIGIQLYTVRKDMERDFEGTLKNIAAIGYKQVEFAGYFGHSPADVRAILKRYDLDAPSAHIQGGVDTLTKDLEKTIDDGKVIGHQYLIFPYIDEKQRRTLDDYRRWADQFNAAGEKVKKAGLRFGYHNHDFEFAPIDGKLPYDVLLERTKPEFVVMEMDLFWITKGGQSPFTYFNRWPGRFHAVHVKDMDAKQGMVDVGKGKIDFARIFAQSKKAGIRYYFVEHDNPEPSALGSAKASYDYLAHLNF
jgi:sugar phosphate isomerase/epimerase